MISTARSPNQPNLTRICPHCKATILASAAVCPGCKGHLRFDTDGDVLVNKAAWQVEGTLEPDHVDAATEYSIVISVRNEHNEELARQVVNVGSLQGAERRTFTLSIETSEPKPSGPSRRR
jgi:glutaredoxin